MRQPRILLVLCNAVTQASSAVDEDLPDNASSMGERALEPVLNLRPHLPVHASSRETT